MNKEGLIITDNIYCLNIDKLTLAKQLAKELNLSLICYGYQFCKDMLEWDGNNLFTNPGTVSFRFITEGIIVIRNGNMYKEGLSYIYKYCRKVVEIEALNVLLRYLPYHYLTLGDLNKLHYFINYNIPSTFSNEKGIIEDCEFNSTHGSITVRGNKPIVIRNKYGAGISPKELGYIATGRSALEYLVEGKYRLDTILYNNKVISKGDGSMLIEEIVYDTIDMLKVNAKFTKGKEIVIGIDPDMDSVVLVELETSDILDSIKIGEDNALEIIERLCLKHYKTFTVKEEILDEFLIRCVMPEEVLV